MNAALPLAIAKKTSNRPPAEGLMNLKWEAPNERKANPETEPKKTQAAPKEVRGRGKRHN